MVQFVAYSNQSFESLLNIRKTLARKLWVVKKTNPVSLYFGKKKNRNTIIINSDSVKIKKK